MNWVLLATGSALLSAAAAVSQKRCLVRVHALEFSFLASAAVLALSLVVPLTSDVFALSARAYAVLGVKSLLGGVAFLLVMMALERNPISNALPLLGLTPAVTAILAQFVLGEALRPPEWAGLALVVAGVWLLEARTGGGLFTPFAELFTSGRHRFMGGALLLFAISAVGDKLLVSGMKVSPPLVLFHQHVVYCLVFAALLVARRRPLAGLAGAIREQWPLLLVIAVLTIGYRYLQLQATQAGPVALVIAVKRTSIVYATLFGGRLFAEEHVARRLAGAALIVAAGFLFLGRE
jgi:drug/metabolite transporter (DMT)-like permease